MISGNVQAHRDKYIRNIVGAQILKSQQYNLKSRNDLIFEVVLS